MGHQAVCDDCGPVADLRPSRDQAHRDAVTHLCPPTAARWGLDGDVVVVECPCGMRLTLQARIGEDMAPAVLRVHLKACDGTPAAKVAREAMVAANAQWNRDYSSAYNRRRMERKAAG